MLIDFTIANFKSIKEEQTFQMTASGVKELPHAVFHTWEDIALLKVGVMYGANGSGKSNLLEAIGMMVEFVKQGCTSYISANYGEVNFYKPYKLDRTCAKFPTRFEIEFIASDDKRYRYCVAFNKKEILSEELYTYPKKQEVKLFIRKSGKSITYGEQLKGAKKSVEQQLQANQLFLSLAARLGNAQLLLAQEGIQAIHVIDTAQTAQLVQQTMRDVLAWENDSLHDRMNRLLAYTNTGVSRVELRKEPENAPNQYYRPYACHPIYEDGEQVGEAHFNLLDESKGTQQVYGLGGALFTALDKGHTILVDELDISFHSLMSDYLIQLFYHPLINPKNAQLIFTTHDTSILHPQTFRRDQIWFAEKDRYGATSFYSLSEFDFDTVRPNIPFDKWYLSGRFGALPTMRDFAPHVRQQEPVVPKRRKSKKETEKSKPMPM